MSTGSGKDLNKSEAVEGLWAAILGDTPTSTLESSSWNRYDETNGGVNPRGRAVQSRSPDGQTWFTYHLDPNRTIRGRQRMHVAALSGVTCV